MITQAFVLWVVMLATTPTINGEGCSTVTTSGRPVINMCEGGRWTLGIVYIAVNTSSMGTSTSCSCTLSGASQGQDLTTLFTLEDSIATIQNCVQTVIKIESSRASQEIKCGAGKPSYIFPATENIVMTLERPSSVFVTSLCLSVIPNSHAANNIFLTCEGEGTTASIQPTTTAQTTPQTTKRISTSSASPSSASSTSPLIRTTVAVIVVAVLGWTLALALAAALLVLRIRRKPNTSAGTGPDNSAYTSLSDVTRVNPRADPNYAVVQSEQGSTSDTGGAEGARGVYETVEGDSSVLGGGLPCEIRQGSGTYYNA